MSVAAASKPFSNERLLSRPDAGVNQRMVVKRNYPNYDAAISHVAGRAIGQPGLSEDRTRCAGDGRRHAPHGDA
jgi:hypothetical protein